MWYTVCGQAACACVCLEVDPCVCKCPLVCLRELKQTVCEDSFQWPNTAPIEVSPQAHCWSPARPLLPEACMDEKYPRHTHTHTNLWKAHLSAWKTLESWGTGFPQIPLTVWAVCCRGGRGGKPWADDSCALPEGGPPSVLRRPTWTFRLRRRGVGEELPSSLVFAVCLSSPRRGSKIEAAPSDVCLPIKAESRPVKPSVVPGTRRDDQTRLYSRYRRRARSERCFIACQSAKVQESVCVCVCVCVWGSG